MTDPKFAAEPDVRFEISAKEIKDLLRKLNHFAESLPRKEAELLHAMLTVATQTVYTATEFNPKKAFAMDFAKALTPGKAAHIVSHASHTHSADLVMTTQYMARSIVDRG